MNLPHPGNPLQKAFLAVEEQLWGDGGVALISCKVHKEVPELIQHIEPTLYNIHGEAILDFFTPDGYDNAVEVEWDKEEGQVILEGECMAREATNMVKYDWLVNQNLDELLGNVKWSIEACPERGAPKAQFDFENDSHQTFNFGGDGPKAINSNMANDEDEQQKIEAARNQRSKTLTVPHYMPPDEINPMSQCDESTLGDPTADSRLSQMEACVNMMSVNLSLILLLLQKNGTPSSSENVVTQPMEVQDSAGLAAAPPAGRG